MVLIRNENWSVFEYSLTDQNLLLIGAFKNKTVISMLR